MTEIRVLRAPSRFPAPNIRDIIRSRELIWVLAKRGIFSRYQQMALGIMWSFLEPLGQLLVMTIVFGFLIKVPTEGFPFTVYISTAMIPWTYFARTTNAAASSLQEHLSIISKIYFPRLILPISTTVREFFDSVILFVIMILLNSTFGYAPNWKMLFMPILLLYITLPGFGLGLAISAISVKYRDFRPLLIIVLQVGFYATPILYPAALVPAGLQPVYQLNPMYWGVEMARWIMLGKPLAITPVFFVSLLLSAFIVAFGYYAFAVFEQEVVDAQ